MPKTDPDEVTAMVARIYENGTITEVDRSKMDEMATTLLQGTRIKKNKELGIEAHLVSIAAYPIRLFVP